MYDGKAFVLDIWSNQNRSDYNQYHGNYIIGTSELSCVHSTTHTAVNKFASTVTGWNNAANSWTTYALIFKI